MIITLDTKEFMFENVFKRSNNIVLYNNIFNNYNSDYISNFSNLKVEINYDSFINLLKLSINSYTNYKIYDTSIYNYIEELFQYFKITNNLKVKKDLTCKIGNLLINNQYLTNDKITYNLFISITEKSNINYKTDIYFKFIILLFKHKNFEIEDKSLVDFDSENNDILDFLFDYYD
jgi:hypothetical protein